MTVLDALAAIRQAGGRVWVEAGALRVQAPATALPPDVCFVLTENKATLVGLLSAGDSERTKSDAEPATRPSTSPRHWSAALTDSQNLDVDNFLGREVTSDDEAAAVAWEGQRPDEADKALAVALAAWGEPDDWTETVEQRDGQRWRVLTRKGYQPAGVEVDPVALERLVASAGAATPPMPVSFSAIAASGTGTNGMRDLALPQTSEGRKHG